MATIPTLPDKAAGEVVSAADLNDIASACTFLLAKPMVRVHDATGGMTFGATALAVSWTTADFDPDGTWAVSPNPQRLVVQTAGWYKVRYSLQISSTSTNYAFNTEVRGTSGGQNPLGSGTTLFNTAAGYTTINQTTPVTAFCGGSGLLPAYLYKNDYVRLYVQASGAGGKTGVDASMPQSFMSLELVSV